jgi:hypothetical protein
MNGPAGEYLSGRVDRKRDNTLGQLEILTKRHQLSFDHIITLSELRDRQAERITTILSDYTEIVNQVSVVATLTLGSAVGLYSVLIGSESYFHPEWKLILLCISSVLTVCFSITSVIESFFLGVRIDQIEARFVAGVYPHINVDGDKVRKFSENVLEDINAVFNFILITFFTSFISFAFGLLGVAYIGMGRSNSMLNLDERKVSQDFNGNIFLKNITSQTVSDLEPGYIPTVWVVNIIVVITYIFIFWRFFQAHSSQINASSLLRFTLLCGCADVNKTQVKTSMFTPIQYAVAKYNKLQEDITKATEKWQRRQKLIARNIQAIAMKRGRIASGEEKEFYDILKRNVNVLINTNFLSLDRNEIVDASIQSHVKIRSSIVTISELEEFYDSLVLGGDTFDLINNSIQIALEQIKMNLKILDTFLDVEKPQEVEWLRVGISPCGKTLNFFIVVWGITVGLAITIMLFFTSMLLYLPWVIISTCTYGNVRQNVCEFVSSVTLLHFRWLNMQQKKLVKESYNNNAAQGRNRGDELMYYKNKRLGKRRKGAPKYYESLSLKL